MRRDRRILLPDSPRVGLVVGRSSTPDDHRGDVGVPVPEGGRVRVISRSRRLWTTSWGVGERHEPVGMSPLRRSPVPIVSAAELSLWWAEVLSEPVVDGRTLSLFWLDSSGHRLGQVLTLTGAPQRPGRAVSASAAGSAARRSPEVPWTPERTPPSRSRVRAHPRSTMTMRRGPERCRQPSAGTAWDLELPRRSRWLDHDCRRSPCCEVPPTPHPPATPGRAP